MEKIVCSVNCTHSLEPLASLSNPYVPLTTPKSKIYCTSGGRKATEAEVVLNRLGRSFLENVNLADILICPKRKMEILKTRERADRQQKCQICTSTSETKSVSILRSTYLQELGNEVRAEQMVCRKCITNHKEGFLVWKANYIESQAKLRKTEVGTTERIDENSPKKRTAESIEGNSVKMRKSANIEGNSDAENQSIAASNIMSSKGDNLMGIATLGVKNSKENHEGRAHQGVAGTQDESGGQVFPPDCAVQRTVHAERLRSPARGRNRPAQRADKAPHPVRMDQGMPGGLHRAQEADLSQHGPRPLRATPGHAAVRRPRPRGDRVNAGAEPPGERDRHVEGRSSYEQESRQERDELQQGGGRVARSVQRGPHEQEVPVRHPLHSHDGPLRTVEPLQQHGEAGATSRGQTPGEARRFPVRSQIRTRRQEPGGLRVEGHGDPTSSVICGNNDIKIKTTSSSKESICKQILSLDDLEDLNESPLMTSIKLGEHQNTVPKLPHLNEISPVKRNQVSQESVSTPRSSQCILGDLSESCSQPSAEDDDYRDIDLENKEKFKLLQNFFKVISNDGIKINYKWRSDKVSERIERNRSNLLDDMVNTILETIFPDGDPLAYQRIIDCAFRNKTDETNPLVLEKILEAYTNTQSAQVKKFLVMELTLLKKFEQLKELLPGLTLYQYKAAKKQVKESGLSKLPDLGYQNVSRNRRDMDSTVYFVEFLLTFVKDVSYGANKVELSTGETLTCQNAVQEVLVEVIIRMFDIQYEEDKEKYETETTLPFPIKKFGKTTLRKLAKTVPLGQLKSLRGLDYYAASGSEAVDSLLNDLAKKVLPRATCPDEINEIKELEVNLKEAQRHLKMEFKNEVSVSSNVARHCSTWALSDPKMKEFASNCDHEHNAFCAECEVRASSLQAVKKIVEKLFPSDSFEDRETRYEMKENINCIEEWEQHELRGFHQNQVEEVVFQYLDEERWAYVTFDLAMKWLPRMFREPMDAWFAQRGLSWQVVLHWFKREPNADIQIKAYVQIFGAEKQDCFAVYSCLEYTLSEIMTRHPEIDSLALSSDNAGNYHNNSALLSYLPRLAEKFSLSHMRYDFKEPQKGKGPVDARIASMKKNMLVHLNSGNDVATPLEMKRAIDAFVGVKGTTASVVDINRENESAMKSGKTILGITKLFSFIYQRCQNGEYVVRYRQHSGVGTGKVLKLGRADASSFAPVIIAPYSSSGASDDTSVNKKKERANKGLEKAFPCPTCVLSFDSLNLLQDHLDSGNHKKINDIQNQEDKTKVLFVDYINRGRVATINYQKTKLIQAKTGQNLQQGWSLKTREKGGLLPDPAKKVLRELYETGKLTKKKLTPEEAAKILRKRFPNEENMWLKASQVKSQFSAMTKADKRTDGLDPDDVEAAEERRLLQVPLETVVAEVE